MRGRLVSLLLFLALGLPAALPGAAAAGRGPAPALAAWARLDSLARAGRWRRVLAAGETLPENPLLDDELTWRVHQLLGLAAWHLGRLDTALVHLEKAVLWGPAVAENHRNLGALLMAMGRRGRALSEYAEACQVAPDDPHGWADLTNARLDLGLVAEARRSLERARRLAPADTLVARAAARWALAAGEEAAAAAPLRLLLRVTGDRGARRELALVLLHTGHPDSVLTLFATARRETLPPAEQRILLEADRARGDPAYALRLSGLPADSLASSLSDPDLWATAAMICLETGHPGPSLRLWDRALALDPENPAYRHDREVAAARLRR